MTTDFESNLLEQLNPKLSPDEMKRLALEAIQATDTEKVAGKVVDTLSGALTGGLKGATYGAGVGATAGGLSDLLASAVARANGIDIAAKEALTEAGANALRGATLFPLATAPLGAVQGAIKGYRKSGKPVSTKTPISQITKGQLIGTGAAGAAGGVGLGILGSDLMSDKKKIAGALTGALKGSAKGGLTGAVLGAGAGMPLAALIRNRYPIITALDPAVSVMRNRGLNQTQIAALLPLVDATRYGAQGAGLGAVVGGIKGGLKGHRDAKKLKTLSDKMGVSLTAGAPVGVVAAASGNKKKTASATLMGLRYASTASYKDTLEKRAFIGGAAKAVKGLFNPSLGQKVSRGFSSVKDAYFGGAPTKGAVGGGLAGAALGAFNKLKNLRQGKNYADMTKGEFHAAMKGLRMQARAGGAGSAAAKKALDKNIALRKRFKGLEGVDPLTAEGAGRFAKEFGGDVLRSMAGYGATGAAMGAGAQALGRAMTRKRMAELGTSALPLAAAGGGGLLLGSALSN